MHSSLTIPHDLEHSVSRLPKLHLDYVERSQNYLIPHVEEVCLVQHDWPRVLALSCLRACVECTQHARIMSAQRRRRNPGG